MNRLRDARLLRKAAWWCIAACAFVLLSQPHEVRADARSDYLIRLLAGSTQFRVRAQAAISLGGVEASKEVVDALSKALADEHPAVRAAAANSLGRVGDASAVRALRARLSDSEPPVQLAVKAALLKLESATRRAEPEVETERAPSGPPKFYVAIGKPGSRVPDVTNDDLVLAQQTLRARLSQMDGVVVAPSDESPNAVRSVLKTRKLKGYYIDSAVTSVSERPGGGTRVAVSVILATYPDRAMRAIMQGAATAMGGGNAKAQAVEGALKSALSQLPQAMGRD